MHDVNIAIDVDFHSDGRCEGRIFCGQRVATITPNGMGHLVVYENFDHVNFPQIELPMDGPGTVGFVIGNLFGDIDIKWALETIQKDIAARFAGSIPTVGNA